jgi:hypothetical protein
MSEQRLAVPQEMLEREIEKARAATANTEGQRE